MLSSCSMVRPSASLAMCVQCCIQLQAAIYPMYPLVAKYHPGRASGFLQFFFFSAGFYHNSVQLCLGCVYVCVSVWFSVLEGGLLCVDSLHLALLPRNIKCNRCNEGKGTSEKERKVRHYQCFHGTWLVEKRRGSTSARSSSSLSCQHCHWEITKRSKVGRSVERFANW